MAIIPILPGNLDHFEIVGRPYSKFVSGSHIGPTGSVELVREQSKSIKDVQVRAEFGSGPIVEDSYLSVLGSMQQNNFAQFIMVIQSGSYSHQNTPTSIDIKTKCHRSKPYKFFIKTSSSQKISNDKYHVEVDITDVEPPVEVSAGSFVIGKKYKITDVSNTNFKLIGASRNSVGIEFTATGAGSGSGKAIFNSVRVIVDRIQNAMNQNLKGDSPTGERVFRHFLVANPIGYATNNQKYALTVKYLKTSVYDGGTSGFRTNNSVTHAAESRIQITPRSIPAKRDLANDLGTVMDITNAQPITADQNKKLRVIRFEPSFKFTKDTMRKNVIKDVLYPSYRMYYPNLHWSYTNYHCLNFFTGSGIPDDSAILYLNKTEPKFSVKLSSLKDDTFNSLEYTMNHGSSYVTPEPGFAIEDVKSIAASGIGCIEFEDIAIGDTITITVPSAAGGDGGATEIRFVEAYPGSAQSYIAVVIGANGDATPADKYEIRRRLIAAINGDSTIRDETGTQVIRWETGGGSNGVEGITASPSDFLSRPRMTLTVGTAGEAGNGTIITSSKVAGVIVPGTLSEDNKLTGGISSEKALILNSTKLDHENRGRYLRLNRKIPKNNRATISFKVVKSEDNYAKPVGRIDLDPTKSIDSYHGIRITMSTAGPGVTKTLILDYYGTETAENYELVVDISAASSANDIAFALFRGIYTSSSNSNQIGGFAFGGSQKIFVLNLKKEIVKAGSFESGKSYTISDPRSTDFTAIGAANNNVGTTFTATDTGTASASVTGGNFVAGTHYKIKTVGTTNFIAIGATTNTVGETFVATAAGSGSGVAFSIVGSADHEVVEGNYLSLKKADGTLGTEAYNTTITVTGDNKGCIKTTGFFGASQSSTVIYDHVKARGINAVKTSDIIVTDTLLINVPANAGGSGAAVTISFVNSLPSAANDTIYILWDASAIIGTRQQLIIDAINGVTRTGKIVYASAGGNNGGQAGVAGVEAVKGDESSSGSVTLIATVYPEVSRGNSIHVTEGSGDDIILDSALSSGRLRGGSDTNPNVLLKPSESIAATNFITVTTNYDEGDCDGDFLLLQSAELEKTEFKQGTLLSGLYYTITFVGDTDWQTEHGAPEGAGIGTRFQKSGASPGTGTGRAALDGIMYRFDKDTSYVGQFGVGSLEGSVIIGTLGLGTGSSAHAGLAGRIRKAILSPNGHNGKIKAVIQDFGAGGTKVMLTQSKKGRSGTYNEVAGHVTLADVQDSGTNMVIQNWTGGQTGADLVIQQSFDGSIWRDLHTVDLANVKTSTDNEWTKVDYEIEGDRIVADYYVRVIQRFADQVGHMSDFDEHVIISDFSITLDEVNFDTSLPYPYSPRENFTFSFWVKPKIVGLDKDDSYRAGTILHLSSSYAFTIISGSSVDSRGRPDKFGLICQFGSSTDVAPSDIPLVKHADSTRGWVDGKRFENGDYPRDGRIITKAETWKDDADLIFLSSENALSGDHWHHVAIRWSAEKDFRSGSIFIDGNLDSTFLLNSASCMPSNMADSRGDPSVLSIGNYYNGRNDGNEGALQSQFFNGNSAYQEGLPVAYKSIEDDMPNYQIDNFLYRDPNDFLYEYENPLKAEVHEIKIYNDFKTHHEIKNDKGTQKKLPEQHLAFYLPMHFTPETPKRDVMQTPFQTFRTTTNDPFNVSLSFGVGGKTMNLPNFLREHVTGFYPRLLNLTASTITTSDTKSRSADEWLNSVPAHRKGNYTILPCDNGLFNPNYFPIITGSQTLIADPTSINYSYRDDTGFSRLGMISLRGMVTSSLLPKTPGDLLQDPAVREASIDAYLEGATPEDPGLSPGSILSIYNRTRDPDSNEVVFFDISNMFYGNRISPETMQIKDSDLSGTRGSVSITLKDDGVGNIYRHDCLTPPAKWNNVGDVIYDEGIVTIKNPVLSHFGRKQFEISFRGEQKVPVMEVTVPVTRNSFNSSSNPNFMPLSPTSDASETADDFVYISGVNLHDENLNIIGKANFAQPIVKRKSDSFMIKLKMDF